MPTECENCKANPVDILKSLRGADLSDKAKLVAILEAFGVTDREQVESILEAKPSTVRQARQALKIQRQKSSGAGNPAPEIQRSAEIPAQTPEIQRQKSSDPSRAHATKESLRDKSYLEVSNPPPTPSWQPREGEEDVGQNVFVNCKTIRHPNFTINVDGVRMTALNSGLSADEIRTFCVGMALQWATEIDGGKEPSKVVPDRISNFLSASIARGKIRADVGEVQRTKAGQSAKMADADIFAQLRAEEAAHAAH